MSQEMRIGDEDRDRVVATLQTAFGEGRLDQIELDDRLGRVFTAKTTSELLPLTSDLPVRAPGRGTCALSLGFVPEGQRTAVGAATRGLPSGHRDLRLDQPRGVFLARVGVPGHGRRCQHRTVRQVEGPELEAERIDDCARSCSTACNSARPWPERSVSGANKSGMAGSKPQAWINAFGPELAVASTRCRVPAHNESVPVYG